MSLEQIKAFLDKVKADTSLQMKLKATKTPEGPIDMAREHGYELEN